MILAYDEFVDFIAGGTTPQSVVEFRPSEAAKASAELLSGEDLTTGTPPLHDHANPSRIFVDRAGKGIEQKPEPPA